MTCCGDFGGKNAAGEPCGARAVNGGPCNAHNPDAVKKPGRPPRALDERIVRKLARMHCTLEEIGAWFEPPASRNTIAEKFGAIVAQERDAGKASLRRAQWRGALKGDKTMLIWLGKQHLGQTDEPPQDNTKSAKDIAREVREALQEMLKADGMDDSAGGALVPA